MKKIWYLVNEGKKSSNTYRMIQNKKRKRVNYFFLVLFGISFLFFLIYPTLNLDFLLKLNNSEIIIPRTSASEIIYPDGDFGPNTWEPIGVEHWSLLDEQSPDGQFISTVNVPRTDVFSMGSISLGSKRVTRINLHFYSMTYGSPMYFLVSLHIGGDTFQHNYKNDEWTMMPFQGLDYGQEDLDDMRIEFYSDMWGLSRVDIDCFYCEVFFFEPPTTELIFIPEVAPNFVSSSTSFTLSAIDGEGSGIANTNYKIDDGAWINYDNAPFTINTNNPGPKTISYYSVDNNGNTEPVKSQEIRYVMPTYGVIQLNGKDDPGWDAFPGDGFTSSTPKLIQDLIIDSSGEAYSIHISNIGNDFYFKIVNCDLATSSVIDAAIKLENVQNAVIEECDISGNFEHSILLLDCSNIKIMGSTIHDINDGNGNGNGIFIENSNNNLITSGNTISNCFEAGIILNDNCDGNIISGNELSSNDIGITIDNGINNKISGNNIYDNTNFGVLLDQCGTSIVYSNTFTNNGINARDDGGSNNQWDDGTQGNRWDDYTGSDQDIPRDDIGDTPYIISGTSNNIDNFPLDKTPIINSLFEEETWEVLSSENLFYSNPTSIKCDLSGKIHVTWIEYDSSLGTSNIYYKYKNALSDEWSVTELVTTDFNDDCVDNKMEIDNNGNIHLIWSNMDLFASKNATNIYYTCKSAQSGEWSTLEVISTEIFGPLYLPRIDIDYNGNVHVIWAKKSVLYTYFSELFYKCKNAQSGEWSSLETILPENDPYFGVFSFVVSDNGDIHLAYDNFNTGSLSSKIYYKYRDHQTGWIPSEVVSNPDDGKYVYPSIDVDGSENVHLTWDNDGYSGAPANIREVFYRYKDAQAGWNSIETITSSTYAHQAFIYIDDEEFAHVVWTEFTGISLVVTYAFKNSQSGEWSPSEIISDDAGDSCYNPQVVGANMGDIHFIWCEVTAPFIANVVYKNPQIFYTGIPAQFRLPESLYLGDGLETEHSFEWDFGDGTPVSNEINPTHIFSSVGTFTVSLTIIDLDGDSHSNSADIEVLAIPVPIVDFEADFTYVEVDEPIQFTFTGIIGQPPATFEWDFDDDDIVDSTEQNPIWSYSSDGIYTVSLTVTDADLDSAQEIKVDYITVESNIVPVADFVASSTNVIEYEGIIFTFTGTSGDAPMIYEWNFGDESPISNDINPTYSYSSAGTYSVSLMITDGDLETDTETKTDYITVSPPVVIADFTADLTSVHINDMIQFTYIGMVDYGPPMFEWDFNNDGTIDSNLQDPTWSYSSAGTYTVSLTIYDSYLNQEIETKIDLISVSNIVPDADFVASSTFVLMDEDITFTFTGTQGDNPVTYQWDFGDGSPISNDVNPIHSYSMFGYYSVSLTITDSDSETDTETKIDYIEVMPPIVIAEFSADQTSVHINDVIQFMYAGFYVYGPATFEWDFNNDGTIDSTLQDPIWSYSSEGIYTVSLTVYDSYLYQDVEIKMDYITVSNIIPVADFVASSTNVGMSEDVTFTFTGTPGDAPTTYEWNFGDGSPISNDINPIHQYDTPGSYTITLTITDNDLESDIEVKTSYITVNNKVPVADFYIDGTPEPQVEFHLIFDDVSGALGDGDISQHLFQWDMNNDQVWDESGYGLSTIAVTFNTEGTYQVTLKITDANGDSHQVTKDVVVAASPGFEIVALIIFSILGAIAVVFRLQYKHRKQNIERGKTK